MVNAKHTTDQYSTLKTDLQTKTNLFSTQSQEQKQQIMEILSGIEESNKVKELGNKLKVKLTKEFREENQDLIVKYKNVIKKKQEVRKAYLLAKNLCKTAKEVIEKGDQGEREKFHTYVTGLTESHLEKRQANKR